MPCAQRSRNSPLATRPSASAKQPVAPRLNQKTAKQAILSAIHGGASSPRWMACTLRPTISQFSGLDLGRIATRRRYLGWRFAQIHRLLTGKHPADHCYVVGCGGEDHQYVKELVKAKGPRPCVRGPARVDDRSRGVTQRALDRR